MSFFRSSSSSSSSSTVQPSYTGLQIQTSTGAVPIQIVYGAQKISPNFVWANNFQTHATYSTTSSSGKGGSGSTTSVSGYTYSTGIIMGLCEGPIGSVEAIWTGQTVSSLSGLVLGLFNGATPQGGWTYLESSYPSEALSYNGLAYLAASDFDLGSSADLPSLWIEVYAKLVGSGFNGVDADPSQCIYDLLTNAQYGVGFPADSIDVSTLFGSSGDSSLQTYCYAAGFALSVALTDQESASSILQRWLQLINCAVIWSGGQLKFISYGDDSVTGSVVSYNGNTAYSFGISGNYMTATQNSYSVIRTVTFNPDLTPIYNLTDDDFIYAEDEDPVRVERIDPYTAYNMQILEIYQRSNYYDVTPITAFDQNAIDSFGLRIASTVTAHEICDPAVGQTSAQLLLQRGLYIKNTYKFKLSWEYCLLEPMDLVTLTDPAIGLNNTAIRITSITEGDDGLLDIEGEEFPGGIATAVAYPVQSKVSTTTVANADAGAINAPILFEPPYQYANGLEVCGAVSGVNLTVWGGAYVYISTDDESYTFYGTLDGGARMGVTNSDLPSVLETGISQTVDATSLLKVDLSESGGTLNQASQADMLAGSSACYIGGVNGGEVIAFQNAVLTATNQYNLSNLLRGAFDSNIVAHPAGSLFCRLDKNIFSYPYRTSDIGSTIYIKFQSFNVRGGGVQDLSEVGSYSYKITGSPLAAELAAPQNLRTVFSSGFEQLYFDEVDDFRTGITYDLLKGESASTAVVVTSGQAHPPFILFGTGQYFVRAQVQPAVGLSVTGDMSAPITITGNMLVANALETWDQQNESWPGTCVNVSVSGTAPDKIVLLKNISCVDLGLASTSATSADDFGAASDDQIIAMIDLGSAS